MTDYPRIAELTRWLNECRHAYYNENRSLISDAEYDALFDELKALESKTGCILSGSPTQTVGYAPVSKLDKTTHKIPLLSLDKTKTTADISKMGREDLVFMPKMDGLTVKLTWENGKLIEAATRGDGHTGELITHNAAAFLDIPMQIPTTERISVAGEAYVNIEDFNNINASLPESDRFKTHRNYAAGSVRQLDPKVCAARKITFSAFSPLEGFEDCNALTDAFYKMLSLNIPVVMCWFVGRVHWREEDVYQTYIDEAKCAAEEKGWPIDGVVIRYNDLAHGDSKGRTSHHYNYAIAYKFEDETETTILRDIEWTVGRTGAVTPTAVFDAVELDGTTVERASLHNIGIIRNLRLGIGDTIKVAKANMIIPQITENLTKSDSYKMILTCPECGGMLTRSEVGSGAQTVCENKDCPGRHLEKFVYFTGKSAMDINGLSRATLKMLIKYGYIKNLSDLYGLRTHRRVLATHSGMGEKSTDKVLDAIEKSRRCTLEKYITALGIPEIGKSAAKLISAECEGSYTKYMEKIACRYDWSNLAGIGEIMNQNIYTFYGDPEQKEEAVLLASNLLFEDPEPHKSVTATTLFSGKNVVLSGRIDGYSKAEAEKILRDAGANIQSGVTAATNYLIYEETNETAKSRMAKQKNIPILTFGQAMEMLKQK
ncbi:MAG: NAD-dependent DNA ligase LigA [Clostridia bacterium]|nr:NAD-dependent DNA ligase LigA [Clostridia bacterium]